LVGRDGELAELLAGIDDATGGAVLGARRRAGVLAVGAGTAGLRPRPVGTKAETGPSLINS
jgi:hypothetical protein